MLLIPRVDIFHHSLTLLFQPCYTGRSTAKVEKARRRVGRNLLRRTYTSASYVDQEHTVGVRRTTPMATQPA